jgi:DNA-binding NtrC family response regulator
MDLKRSSGGTEVNPSATVRATNAVPRLTAVSGPAAGSGLALTRAMATVGRHASNDLALSDPRVSGVHLQILSTEGRVVVRDTGSTNGTWLGPHRVSEIDLAVGGELRVGDTVLRLEIESDAIPPPTATRESFGQLVGRTAVMRELFATLERISPKDLSVLIQGETGTGKEEVARAIHNASLRSAKPFVVIDATALPETLAESLLFGHERGAFTGATERRIGLFEAADGGTVFLDEIGELPPPLQSKFLRVLERHEVVRVGSQAPQKIDIRLVAATHRDLRQEIDAGRFRDDLFFRVAQVQVSMPSLRDRASDIPLLCQKLLSSIDRTASIMIDAAAMEHLVSQPWPGNVRELRNVLARAAALATGGIISRHDVSGEGSGFRGTPDERAPIDLGAKFAVAKDDAIDRFERTYLAALMRRCEGNVSRAAREADLARHHLRDLLKKRGLYGISWPDADSDT